jgi:hypothetical protein
MDKIGHLGSGSSSSIDTGNTGCSKGEVFARGRDESNMISQVEWFASIDICCFAVVKLIDVQTQDMRQPSQRMSSRFSVAFQARASDFPVDESQ